MTYSEPEHTYDLRNSIPVFLINLMVGSSGYEHYTSMFLLVVCFLGEPGQAAESICPEVGVHFYASRSTSKVSPCEFFQRFIQVVAFCSERHYN